MLSRNFDRAELLQMRCRPLRVEEREFERAQTFNQSDQGDLRGVRYTMKHRFAKERAADGDAVKSAGEFIFAPRFDRMRVAELVQPLVAFDDLAIDPGVLAFRAGPNHVAKAMVDLDLENFFPGDASQRVRDMKILQRNDRARVRRKPSDRILLHRHRENAKPIALQQKLRVDHLKQNARQDLPDGQDFPESGLCSFALQILLILSICF